MKLSEEKRSFPDGGGIGGFSVIGNTSWTAVSDSPWVVITAGTAGNLSGQVTYTVAANALLASRSAVITVSGDGLVSTHTVYQPVATLGNDFSGNRSSDLAVLDGSTGRWFIRDIAGANLGFSINWGWPGVIPVSGDFDGDGKSDLAIFDSNTGRWFIRGLDGTVIAWEVYWGWPTVQPVGR
jgi:hypothetical protein